MEPINGKLELEKKMNDPIEYYALEIIPCYLFEEPMCVRVCEAVWVFVRQKNRAEREREDLRRR
ncbi:hypothetical protein HYC85_020907 [Camellia sinensis]|uniref:Uncharacterized protein n=1 Tax=Camellia sinensis TaxID=4442 RepID=A0A7J7GSW3_CAMSI|nr:hypothetical protein HYC85_020907 [Camellia sinensis]